MEFKKKSAEIFIPDSKNIVEALNRTTHMAISAHQDDIEIMAYDGILKCFGREDNWFTGVVLTNGNGSARNGVYAAYSDEEMIETRNREQKKAAFIGEYSAQILLQYTSSEVKNANNLEIVEELKQIIIAARPKIIYTHNPADKHDTHVATLIRVISAIRELPSDIRPEKVYGCEVWRDLDWMNDEDKIVFDVSRHENLSTALLGVFDSQICGGKRYDLAISGRRRAHATFSDRHTIDRATANEYAIDLTPLVIDKEMDIIQYISNYIMRFSEDVLKRINKFV